MAISNCTHKNYNICNDLLFCFSPDEEIGGIKGMSQFVNMDDFKSLNVGFALDEGTCFYQFLNNKNELVSRTK